MTSERAVRAAGASPRLGSVDALRGLAVAAMLLVNNPGDWGHVYAPLTHAAWHGWTPTDLVFPFFLFIVGVSLALSMGARIDAGDGAALRRTVWVRAGRIVLLGLALHVLAWWLLDKPALRVMGVLQRIGLCFALAGVIVLHTRRRGQWAWTIALLIGWAALLLGGGTLEKVGNIASRLDAWLLGPHAYEWDPVTGLGHEPEGVLSTLGALATTLLGWHAGQALRAGRVKALALGGAVIALAGWALDAAGVLPINKQLWTSSYVLLSGGLAALGLVAAHALIDVRGWPAVGRSFGVNAIAAYAGAWVMSVVLPALGWQDPLYRHGFGWLGPLVGPAGQSLAFALAFVAVWWAVVRVMDAKRVYIKV